MYLAHRALLVEPRCGGGGDEGAPGRLGDPRRGDRLNRGGVFRLGRCHALGNEPAPYRCGGPPGAHRLCDPPRRPAPCPPSCAVWSGTCRACRRWRLPITARCPGPTGPSSRPCPPAPQRCPSPGASWRCPHPGTGEGCPCPAGPPTKVARGPSSAVGGRIRRGGAGTRGHLCGPAMTSVRVNCCAGSRRRRWWL
jgi:hypothetical protein